MFSAHIYTLHLLDNPPLASMSNKKMIANKILQRIFVKDNQVFPLFWKNANCIFQQNFWLSEKIWRNPPPPIHPCFFRFDHQYTVVCKSSVIPLGKNKKKRNGEYFMCSLFELYQRCKVERWTLNKMHIWNRRGVTG